MAQLLAFIDHIDGVWILGSGARFDGTVQKFDPGKGRYPRHGLWSFIPAGEGDWGMLADHRHGKVLLASLEDLQVKLGIPRSRDDQRLAWWRMEDRGNGYVAFVPYFAPTHALTSVLRDQPVNLKEAVGIDRKFQEWLVKRVDAAPYVPLPAFDDAAIDETFYNFEVVTQDGAEADLRRLFLTVGNELALESPLKIGTDPKSPAAQFRFVPVQTGRILSNGKPFVTEGRATEELLFAKALEDHQLSEVEMINLNGSRAFVSGDRVALRARTLFYIGWKKAGNDLTAKAWSPGENETFIIQKVSATGEIRIGEIKAGDSFALLAGNGRYLTDDRGTATTPVKALGQHIAAWETFVLGEPKVRAFRIHVKNIGHPLTMGDGPGEDQRPITQRFGLNFGEFELVDRGDGMINLRMRNSAWKSAVVPATDAGVDAGQMVAARLHTETIPGIFFRLQVAPASAWPDTPDLTMEKYRDPVEDMARTLTGGIFSLAGQGFSAATGIPGGGAVFTFLFDHLFPAQKVSQYDLFNKFRADILRDVKNLIAEHAELQARGALQLAREHYLVNYLNSRRENMDGGDGFTQTKGYAIATADKYTLAMVFLSLSRDTSGRIKETDQNISLVRAGLPVYAICVGEYINALQEVALLHAYQPKLALPDVWLKTRGQYVTATPADGVRYASTDKPLARALRVLNRNGAQTLKHGDTVVLRSPVSTNVTAAGGGGGALEAKTPASKIEASAVFTIERVSNPPSVAGQPIGDGDSIALRASNGTYWVSAPDGGGPLTAGGTRCGEHETFRIEIKTHTVKAEPPAAAVRGELPYTEHLKNLRTFAAARYNDVRDMFEFLVNERTKRVYGDQQHWKHTRSVHEQMLIENYYALSFRDPVYNIEVDRDAPSESEIKPYGWDDPANCSSLQWGIDEYREHLRRVYYYFKYRYFDAMRPLLTIGDDTQKLCDQMWSDPLMATEYSYIARTAREYQA
jgi:hypothetical protein